MKGVSYTYFTTENAKSARELVVILREATAHVPPQLEEMAMFGGGGGARSMSYSFIACVLLFIDQTKAGMVVATVDEVVAAVIVPMAQGGDGGMDKMMGMLDEIGGSKLYVNPSYVVDIRIGGFGWAPG
jgi:hypothetical protein